MAPYLPVLASSLGGILGAAGSFFWFRSNPPEILKPVMENRSPRGGFPPQGRQQRFSDMVGGWLHVLLQAAGFALAGFAVVCGVGMLVMGLVATWLGRDFRRRELKAGIES